MNSSLKIATITLAIALSSVAPGDIAFAAQPVLASNNEHSTSAGQAVSDTWITTKVKAELATTQGIKSTDISVTTTNGVVTLIGVLPTETEVKKAIAAAKSVKGVKDVNDSGLKTK